MTLRTAEVPLPRSSLEGMADKRRREGIVARDFNDENVLPIFDSTLDMWGLVG